MLLNREPYKTVFKIFTFIGFWDEIPIVQRRWTFNVPLTLNILFILMVYATFFRAHDFNDAITALSTLPILTVIIFSIFDFLHKKEKLNKFLALVNEIESENPDVSVYIDKACKFNTMIYSIVLFVLFFTHITYAIIPSMTNKLVFPLHLHEKLDKNAFVFYFLWIFQVSSGFYSTYTSFLLFEFRNSLLVLITHIMNYYCYKLSNLSSMVSDHKAKLELEKSTKLHLQIKELMSLFMDVFSISIYLLLTTSALVIVSVIYVIVNSHRQMSSYTFMIFMAATALCQIFIPCFHSSNIETESANLIHSLFSSDWTNSDVKYQKLMVIMMENMKQPMKLRGYGLSEINLEFFIQTLNTAYSMYAVLQSFKY
ncbi:hypothetical protein PVAND_003396 [Polypedilum vanderplanki]|uniref:Odorant receptor n=1 Tax=Polypedilum vanderplanki TaxID=319348 RepID=A0A9J6BTX2_POLVA|nr:hypothetical protein PVAND_003396 [Polypedilum vanderplanki]